MIRKRWKRGGALLLALALVLSGTGILKTRAAVAVDVDLVNNGLTLTVSAESLTTMLYTPTEDAEVSTPEVLEEYPEVALYKVANITESGSFNVLSDFHGVDVSFVENNDVSAETWENRAAQAYNIVLEGNINPYMQGTIALDQNGNYTVTFSNKDAVNKLSTGLYLIVPEEVQSNYYSYTFAPSLVSLPDNSYYENGNDDWDYDVEVTLKPEQTPRYGSLDIIKTLTDMNTTFGSSTTFVYQIDITTLRGETETRIEAIEFTGAGTNTLTVSDIEAGSTVTVTELYSGAGYKISGSDTAGAIIIADGLEGAPVQGEFTNVPDNTMTGGYGAINHFVQNADGTDYTHSRLDGGAVNAPAE